MSINADRVLAVRTGKTIYRDGDTVLKVFESDYSKSGILNEALNQTRVEETGLRVPRVLEVLKIDGKWAIRLEYIKGTTLQKQMDDDPGRFDDFLNTFIDIQMEVFSHHSSQLNVLYTKLDRKINEAPLDSTTRYDLHTRLSSMPRSTAVCHGDFVPSNIVVQDDGTPYLLDWAHVTQGSPAADAALTYMRFWLSGNIDGAEKYLLAFCTRSRIAKNAVQRWMPLVAAAQLTKARPEEREFLNQWVNVVEYE